MTHDEIKELVCQNCKGLSRCHTDGDGYAGCPAWQLAEKLDKADILTDEVWSAANPPQGYCRNACAQLAVAICKAITETDEHSIPMPITTDRSAGGL